MYRCNICSASVDCCNTMCTLCTCSVLPAREPLIGTVPMTMWMRTCLY